MEKSNKKTMSSFVESMLKSAEEKTAIQPQTRQEHVDLNELEKVMNNLQKGLVRKKN